MSILNSLKKFFTTNPGKVNNTVALSSFGTTAVIDVSKAQLVSLKRDGVEYIYQQNGIWKESYTQMFPICFALKDNKYKYDGEEVLMNRHGFWKNMEWKIVHQEDTMLQLQAINLQAFKTSYPFDFEFNMVFDLSEEGINVECHIKNIDEKRMYFNFGQHPAFNLLSNSAEITFETKETIEAIHANYREENPVIEKREKIGVHNFDFETINCYLIENAATSIVKLDNGKGVISIKSSAPHWMLWKPTNKSPFIAIESSYGLPDYQTQNPTEIKDKKGIQSLAPGSTFKDVLHLSLTSNK